MINCADAVRKVKDILGEDYWLEAMRFFYDINNSDADDIIFISRKAYLAYEAALRCGLPVNPNKRFYSDRIVNKPERGGVSRFHGRSVLLVDDTLNHGGKLFALFDHLSGMTVSMLVFALNAETQGHIDEKYLAHLNYQLLLTTAEILSLSQTEVQLIIALGIAYYLEVPVFHMDAMDESDFLALSTCLRHTRWAKHRGPYKVSLLTPRQPCLPLLNQPTLFEYVQFDYVKWPSGLYTVNLVPVKALTFIDRAAAVYILDHLCAAYPNDGALRDYVTDVLQYSKDDGALCDNLYKSINYLLCYCLGLTFFAQLSDAYKECGYEMPDFPAHQIDVSAHFRDDFVAFLKTLRVCDIAGILAIFDAAPAFHADPEPADEMAAPVYTKRSAQLFLGDRVRLTKIKRQTGSPHIIIHELIRDMMHGARALPKTVIACLVTMIIKSECSVDIHVDSTGRIFKTLVPGENEHATIKDTLPHRYLRNFKCFVIGVGDYETALSHVRAFNNAYGRALLPKDINLQRAEEVLMTELPGSSDFYNICFDFPARKRNATLERNAYELGFSFRHK